MGLFGSIFSEFSRSRRRAEIRKARKVPPFSQVIPSGHHAPLLRADHPSYDKFFPTLSAVIQEAGRGLTVDIGANIGLSFGESIAQFPRQTWILVEGAEEFGGLLKTNIDLVKDQVPEAKAECIIAMVGSSALPAGSLVAQRGTASRIDNPIGVANTSLDNLLEPFLRQGEQVALLKIDTDGFDWDVLNSAAELIEHSKPMIFLEGYVSKKFLNLERYVDAISRIEDRLDRCAVFDNTGALVHPNMRSSDASDLLRYTYRHSLGLFTKRISYFDFVFFSTEDMALVDLAIKRYLSSLAMPLGLAVTELG